MRRPSRGFLVAAGALLLVVAAALGSWIRLRAPNRWAAPPPPDVWEREDAPGDLRQCPDGPAIAGWTYAGRGRFDNAPRADSKDFVVVMPADAPKRSAVTDVLDRLRGLSPAERIQRDLEPSRNLYRRRDPIVTASGRWWVYSARWWLPTARTPPAVPPK